MAPEIPGGDVVIIDTSITWHVKDGIYLINFPGKPGTQFPPTQLIRSVIKGHPGREDEYWVTCLNESYQGDWIKGEDMNIAGLVTGSVRCSTH
ncbi:MAG: hypothetical protein EPO47_05055 [Rugosibacter sp.]|nr:MAG: hypothetical protein EPO47_05055 [Rugosibacter sp.]